MLFFKGISAVFQDFSGLCTGISLEFDPLVLDAAACAQFAFQLAQHLFLDLLGLKKLSDQRDLFALAFFRLDDEGMTIRGACVDPWEILMWYALLSILL